MSALTGTRLGEPARRPVGQRPRLVAMTILLALVLLILSSGSLCLFPFLLLAWRDSGKSAMLALAVTWLVAGAVLSLTAGGQEAAVMGHAVELAAFSLSGLVFGGLLLNGRSLTVAGALAVMPWVLLVAAIIGAGLVVDRQAVEATWQQSVLTPFEDMVREMEKSGNLDDSSPEQSAALQGWVKSNHLYILYSAPGMVGSFLILVLWMNLWITRLFEVEFAGLEPLSSWRPPDGWFWGLIAGVVLTLIGMNMSHGAPALAVGVNVLILAGSIYFLSGLAVMSYAARRWGLSPWFFLVAVGLVALSGGLPFLALVGTVDFWLDFRQRWQRSDEDEGPPGL